MSDPRQDSDITRTVIARPGASAPTAQDDRVHYLVVIEGAEPGKRIEVGEGKLVIGRSEPADIVIKDALVSRNHCRIGLTMGEVFVTDLGSSNGTYVAGKRITASTLVAPGERVTVGTTVLEHDWASRREVEAARAVSSDLDKAKQYVRSLLPKPIAEGPVRTDWVLQPSAKLGGDLFGYHFIDANTFAIYLFDVTGHGTGPAMHAVSVMNVLRKLTGADAREPARTATYLNEMFPMESHGGMLLSLWYGVYDIPAHSLAFTSAGHHASQLVDPQRRCAEPLDVSNVLIGMMPGYPYRGESVKVEPGSSLYVFSDGAFEIEKADGSEWGIGDFLPLLTRPAVAGKTESQRILDNVTAATGRTAFVDDFTLVVATLG